MNSGPTNRQYRRLAEGLLREALEAPVADKQEFIHQAASYLAYARSQERSDGAAIDGASPDEMEDRHNQVRQLIKLAIEVPTPDGIVSFLNFATSFRRLGIWNARMAYIQRPGARVIASEYEWKNVGRSVAPDAIPIMILWPFSPIRYVYELEDTEPRIDRNTIDDPFAAKGEFNLGALEKLTSSLEIQKRFRIAIEYRRQCFSRAGSAASHGNQPPPEGPWANGCRIGEFATENSASDSQQAATSVPSYRVTVNDRLNPTERFITIAHELGHIFLGHLGECVSRTGDDEESGWPDRISLGKNEKEVEAEAVAYHVASRAGVISASAQYMKTYAKCADLTKINVELIVRSAARIERMAKIHYGSMAFKAPR